MVRVFSKYVEAVKELSQTYSDIDFVFPMHLNPNVRKAIWEVFVSPDSLKAPLNIFFIEPLDYLPFVYLMGFSYLLLTDSGGLQEEAPSLGKPVLVMRDTSERPEALAAGTVKLTGTSRSVIVEEVSRLLISDTEYVKMSNCINPYGDGEASGRICNILFD